MKNVYPVIFTELHDKKNTVLIEVPDFEIMTEGYGLTDAVYMARDAIGLKGICYEDDGKTIPDPSPVESINVGKGVFAEYGTGHVSLVDIDFVEYRKKVDNKAVRKNVTQEKLQVNKK